MIMRAAVAAQSRVTVGMLSRLVRVPEPLVHMLVCRTAPLLAPALHVAVSRRRRADGRDVFARPRLLAPADLARPA
ncbi:hypothetical protein BN12_980005 [Nostocoides japonicum T1-X7]|uniref:Uncharacterized protein n=1 Tax=Nostocoides japonicum T1-X7 TaxID=1194083 RepID=A0A077M2E5_9MICO|nr:hypothetical protein BN12_980005 [Tetrasphaera japonica T1-X7]